jgi:FkbM family methyltransferase
MIRMPRVPAVLSQLRFVADLAMPLGLREALDARRAFRLRGLERLSLLDARRAWLSGLQLLPPDLPLRGGLVVDVGANEGWFVASVLNLAPEARVIAVEPTPEPLATLRSRFGSAPNVTIVPKALAAEPGTVTMRIPTGSHTGSSLLMPRKSIDDMYGGDTDAWGVAQEVPVEADTLDHVVAGQDVTLMKIDVQGGELGVLAGGEATMQRTRCVLIEIVFVSHYEGDSPFPMLNRRMEELGFELHGFSDPYRTPDGTAMWGDACYVRTA